MEVTLYAETERVSCPTCGSSDKTWPLSVTFSERCTADWHTEGLGA